MTKTHKNRLAKLRDFLKTSFNAKGTGGKLSIETDFEMDHFAQVGFKEKKCGTSACALGWATTVFPKHLRIVEVTDDDYDSEVDDLNLCSTVRVQNIKTKAMDFDAGEEFFGLTVYQAEYLFEPNWYDEGDRDDNDDILPTTVAKRIDILLETPDFDPQDPDEDEE